EDTTGANPHPVKLLRPAEKPLSVLAQVGQKLFFDPSLSASGKQSCASCHDPARAFGPPTARDVELGGIAMDQEGLRPPPGLTYLYRQKGFTIGPSTADLDVPIPLDQLADKAQTQARQVKSAGTPAEASALVPAGGLFWDGRIDMLMDQAMGPMMNPAEMANKDRFAVVDKLRRLPYLAQLGRLFGQHTLDRPEMLFIEAMSALSAYQVESGAFHRFNSKYDAWLEGKERLTHAEMRGLRLFNDPEKGNCAACHLSQPAADGLPPLFTDSEFEALGVPRNPRLKVNRDPAFFDMGLCGPARQDLARQTQYCGMFLTPTLRNSARRGVYFHNGVYHNLRDVLNFYNQRAAHPEKVYPRDAQGRLLIYNDLPAKYHGNIDVADAPFTQKRGDTPPLSDADIDDIIAFLHTLDDR
ncbi:MAG TPA: cytochrome c peroxidase, partial [Novosphingobium sp.]|nr:cytochrome c peroxidase [Novosphingobium sp.]